MDFIKYDFNEDTWCIYLTEDDDDDLTTGEAEVFFEKKEIYIKKNGLRLPIIRHEVFHVYLGYCYIGDASLTDSQLEEVACALFADKGEKMIERSKDIYKKLKALRDEKKE